MSSLPKAPFEPTLQAPLLATLLASLAIGCATPGPPRPPSLRLPEAVTDLSARRVGNQILLAWTTPTKTTDNLAIKETLTARICRAGVPESPAAVLTPPRPVSDTPPPKNPNQPPVLPCTTVHTASVKPGPSTAVETLPPTLASDPIILLDYRVEILNPAERSAGLSNSALSISGSAPPPVAALRATPTATGVILQWTPTSTPSVPTTVELSRTDQTLAASRQLHADTSSTPNQSVQLAGKESPEVRLRTAPPEPSRTTEPSGTIDTTARFGDIYRYTAQRVRTVTLSGHTLELRSTLSEPITLALHDTFPPATPTGLYAVPGQTDNTAFAIDLSWQPNKIGRAHV